MPRTPYRWALTAASAIFVAYGSLLVYCDVVRPGPPGMELSLSAGQMIITGVEPESPAARAGLLAGDVLLNIDGRRIAHAGDWQAVAANAEFGHSWLVLVERDGRALSQLMTIGWDGWQFARTRAGVVLFAIRGVLLLTLSLGVFIAFRRPHDPVALTGAWLLSGLGVFSVVWPYRIAALWRDLPTPLGWSLWLPFLSGWGVGALLFAFFSVFASHRRRSGLFWTLTSAPMGVALMLFLPSQLAMVYSPARAAAPETWPMNLVIATNLAYMVAAYGMLAWSYRRLKGVNARRRVRVMALGSSVGWVGGVVITLGYWFGRADPTEPVFASPAAAAGALMWIAVPSSFAYAILRHRLFDVRVMVGLGVRYAVAKVAYRSLSPAVAVVVALDLVGHRDLLLADILRTRGLLYVALAGTAVLFSLRRRRWLEALDRRFFRERYDGRAVLSQLATDVRRTGDFDTVLPRVVARIESALHPAFAAVLVRRRGAPEHDYTVAAIVPATHPLPSLPVASTLMRVIRVLDRPIDVSAGNVTWLRDQLPDQERASLRKTGIDLIVPIALSLERDEAVLALGMKRSEEPYTGEDLDLLTAIAGNLALLVDRPARRDVEPDTFEECPTCGRCYDPGPERCDDDNERLTPVRHRRTLAARYRLDRRLGEGGMGVVYAAFDTALDRDVAAKLVRRDLIGGGDAAERFRSEARVAARFSHPNVVTVHDFGVNQEGVAFIVMELLVGQTLRAALRQGGLAPDRVLAVVNDVANAMAAGHRQGLIHRDLKPENLFLVRQDGREATKVLDFGIARATVAGTSEALTGLQATQSLFVGTPLYMAPEQIRRKEPSVSWDLWALAMVACEAMTGSHPLEQAAPGDVGMYEAVIQEHLASHAPAWQRFFTSSLAIDPSSRPANVDQFLRDFSGAAAEAATARPR